MTSCLPPAIALAFVRELSTDFRAGIVLDEALEPLAGDLELAAPARALLEAHARACELRAGEVFAARTATHAIVVVTGPHALPAVMRRDIRTALSGLGGAQAQETPFERPEGALVKAVVTASADAFRRHRAVSRSE
ncbi:hypothetical protein OJ997_08230 [Solirubrobacter phytolaccae]|uniref:Uncharacterized protein n=1 Tax=Solirubrobacter phytolaccae TaxID=1404360 RepID=A0A9X3N8A9_9ACTN|nr:hypothetical protein [Solirubrobacter phytolaccae]MDA0180279.1 hypothetical protein [Solirubrobacter phytolaccae]